MQLAKSAHRSGVEILMQRMGITPKDIGCVYMAGGFENGIHIDSAVTIGLLPGELRDRIKAVGNSALGGVAAYLSNRDNHAKLEKIL